jgi:hypothetical protein
MLYNFLSSSLTLLRKKASAFVHGQASSNRTTPWLSLTLEVVVFMPCVKFIRTKTDQLKVVNLAQTTFRFTPVRYRAPHFVTENHLQPVLMCVR